MKIRILIFACFIMASAISSCTKESSVKPATTQTTGDMVLGTGDGRPTGN